MSSTPDSDYERETERRGYAPGVREARIRRALSDNLAQVLDDLNWETRQRFEGAVMSALTPLVLVYAPGGMWHGIRWAQGHVTGKRRTVRVSEAVAELRDAARCLRSAHRALRQPAAAALLGGLFGSLTYWRDAPDGFSAGRFIRELEAVAARVEDRWRKIRRLPRGSGGRPADTYRYRFVNGVWRALDGLDRPHRSRLFAPVLRACFKAAGENPPKADALKELVTRARAWSKARATAHAKPNAPKP